MYFKESDVSSQCSSSSNQSTLSTNDSSSPPSSRSSSLTPRSNSPPLPSRSSSPLPRPSSSNAQSGNSTPNTSDSFSTSTPRSDLPLPSRSSSPSLRSSSPPPRPSSSNAQSGKSTPNTSDSFSTSTPRSNLPLPSRSSSPFLRSSSPLQRPSSSNAQFGKSTQNTSDSFSTSTSKSNLSSSRRSSDTSSSTQLSSDKAYVDFSEVLKKKPNKAEDIYSVLTSNFIPPENTWNQSIKEYPKAGIGKVEKRSFQRSMCPDGFAYSLQNKGVYCVLCSLLVTDDVLQRSGLKVFISTPCSDWKRIKEKMKIHMQSKVYLLADTKKVANIKAFEKGVSIKSFYQERLREKRQKNTEVLHTLVDSILYLAIQGLPLRGHDESLKDD